MRSFCDSLFARLLGRLARAIYKHPKWFVYPQVALAALGVWYTATHLQVDMDRDHLVGPQMKYHQVYLQYRKEFPGEDDLALVVRSGSLERNRQFVERMAARLKPETNLFTDLFYKADLASLGRKGLLLAPQKELSELHQSLTNYLPFIREFSQATNLVSLFGLVNRQFRMAPVADTAETRALVNAVPFLQQIIEEASQSVLRPGQPPPPALESLLGGGAEAEQSLYVTFDQGRIFVLTVRPRSEATTGLAIERFRELLRQTRIEVPGVDAGLTGGPVLEYDEMRQSERDTTVASVAALVICTLLFIGAYRQLGRPLKAAFCLLCGLSFTLAFATLAIGHLNILTITFVPMLIGLGIDFGIHFITRFEEEMRNRRGTEEALFRSMAFTGQGIVTGGLTTAAAFLAMALTRFKGIQEMGLISGVGLLLCLVPMITVLPALLLRGRQNLKDHALGPLGQARLNVENLWLQRPYLVLGATLFLCVASAVVLPRVYFDYDLLHMQSHGLPSVVYEERLLHAGGRSAIYGAVLADSPQQALEFQHRIERLPAVSSVESMAGYFVEDARPKLRIVRSIRHELSGLQFAPVDRGPANIQAISASGWYLMGYLGLAANEAERDAPEVARQLRSLRESLSRFRKLILSEKPEVPVQLGRFQRQLFASLQGMFRSLREQDTSGPLRPEDLPPALRDRFVGVTGKQLLQVYPRKDLWEHENQREFLEELQSVVPAERVTGDPVELYAYTTLLKDSYQQAAWYSLVAITLMVLAHFRSIRAAMLTLLPVGIGGFWMLGVMGWTGVPFNPANIMTLPLVVGVGVTNGVHVLNRFAEEQNPGILAKSTGKSVLVSGLTALTGFGTLLLAKHQGIRSLGEVMSVGIAACMLAGLTFLPAVLCLVMRGGWRLGLPRVERKAA